MRPVPVKYQAWIAVSGVPEGKEQRKEFTRRVRQRVGGYDKSASGATRVAGTENFKLKYAPNYPTVSVVETHPGRVMTPEQLGAQGLLSAKPEPKKAEHLKFTQTVSARTKGKEEWPSYEESLKRAGPNQEGTGPDRSNPVVASFLKTRPARDPFFRVPAGSAPGDLHDQRGGVAAYEFTQNHQDARLISQ